MSVLQDFYTNQGMRDAVRDYFIQAIEAETVFKVFQRGDVSHIADAKDLIELIFKRMEVDFKAKKEPTNLNNQR